MLKINKLSSRSCPVVERRRVLINFTLKQNVYSSKNVLGNCYYLYLNKIYVYNKNIYIYILINKNYL